MTHQDRIDTLRTCAEDMLPVYPEHARSIRLFILKLGVAEITEDQLTRMEAAMGCFLNQA